MLLPALASLTLAIMPHHADDASATEPSIHPTLLWTAAQLVPSPEWIILEENVRFGLRWQITPILYSFGINRKLSPWRFLIAEPLIRHGGSIEMFASPEFVSGGSALSRSVVLRAGVRSYFPLVQRGEYLSFSIGGSALAFRGHLGAAYEAGLYTMGGLFGLQITYCPTPLLRSTTLTLHLRYF